MDTYDAIARRTSVRTFKPDPVPRYVIERLLAAAVRAPNHKLTEPWRFVVVAGEAKRRYAGLRREYRRARFDPPDTEQATKAAEKTYREHLETPAFIFVLCAVSEDPVRREEDYPAPGSVSPPQWLPSAAERAGQAAALSRAFPL